MRVWQRRSREAAALAAVAMVVASCSSAPPPSASESSETSGSSTASGSAESTAAPAAPELEEVDVQATDDTAAAPFDEPRKALVPKGWTMSVFARTTKPRLLAWAPDGKLLVSVPSAGQVLSFEPTGAGPLENTLLSGLDQPHGLTFAGPTLYVAESDQIDAYDYANGAATAQRTVAPGLPDAKSPDLRGAYSHALKSVAVGPDGAVYFSIGSTGNVSVEDRTANPPRATIMRIPPGGGPAAPFATGVRNGTGLAVAPDGSVWTAVNNRDNIAFPGEGPDYGKVVPDYVDDHPRESLAKLTPGRELGWPYCNPDGGPADLPFIRDVQTNADGQFLDCASLPPVEQSFGAHSAPLGLSFTNGGLPAPYDRGALVGVHGSWNRQNPQAPDVSFFPWQNGSLGGQQTLVGGFQSEDGNRWGRPVAAVAGPDGAIYVSDDYANAIYRLAPPAG